jgi:hypothetical protein
MEDGMAKVAMQAEGLRSQGESTNALVTARIRRIFDAVPALVGFSFDTDLLSVEVELQRWPGYTWSAEAHAEIEAHIQRLAVELIADDPEGVEALRGRTFARSLQ